MLSMWCGKAMAGTLHRASLVSPTQVFWLRRPANPQSDSLKGLCSCLLVKTGHLCKHRIHCCNSSCSCYLPSPGLEMRAADAGNAGFKILDFLLVNIGTHSFCIVITLLWNDAWNGKKWKQFLPWMPRSQKLQTWIHTTNGSRSPLTSS